MIFPQLLFKIMIYYLKAISTNPQLDPIPASEPDPEPIPSPEPAPEPDPEPDLVPELDPIPTPS